MQNDILQNIWALFVFSMGAIVLFFLARLIIGVTKKNSNQIKLSIKLLVNFSFSSGFVFFPFVDFGLWVTAPHLETKEDSLNVLTEYTWELTIGWFLWAFLWLSQLFIFNFLYAAKFEKGRNWRRIISLFFIYLSIMSFGILCPAYSTYLSLAADITGYKN